MDRQWSADRRPNQHGELRLFCLPYAGGRASIYHRWQEAVPRHIQVCALELPGRGRLMRKPPFRRLAPLVKALVHSIETAPEGPFALFGHSMGGLIAFELARALRARGGRQPEHLFVSATPCPVIPPALPLIHCATDARLKKKLHDLNGTPQELLDNDELMALVLPTFRADFSVLETYQYQAESPLDIPITVFGGKSDSIVPPAALSGWGSQSTEGARLEFFAGDHFFVHSAATEVIGSIARVLGEESSEMEKPTMAHAWASGM